MVDKDNHKLSLARAKSKSLEVFRVGLISLRREIEPSNT